MYAIRSYYDFVGAMITQDIIDLLQMLRNILSVRPENRPVEILPSVGVIKRQSAFKSGRFDECGDGTGRQGDRNNFV